jgi:hypothetical protein
VSEARQSLKCLSCGAVAWTDGTVPEACPSCKAPWRAAGVAILETVDGTPYVMPNGASILKD